MKPSKQPRRFKLAAALFVLALALAGGGLLTRAHAGGSPLAGFALPSPVHFEGRLAERVDAGTYGYLRVERDDGAGLAWVVAVKPRAAVGDHLAIDAVGRAKDFDSKRLARRFDDLWFAVVRKN